MQDKLTVVVPYRDRPEQTIRFANWANAVGFPFPVIFADGSPDAAAREVLAERRHFPRLRYRLFDLPNSGDIAGLLRRIVMASELAETPYAMVHPNDDFFLVSAMQQAVDFLEGHPDHAGVTGELVDFHLDERPHLGRYNLSLGRMTVPGKVFRTRSYDQPSGLARMTDHIMNMFNNGPVYSVCRIDAFRRMHATALAVDPPDWHFADRAMIFTLLACGKVHGIGPIALHQGNGNTSGLEMITRDPTWLHWAQRPEWQDVFNRLLEAVAAVAAEVDGIDPQAARTGFRNVFYAAVGKQILEGFHPELRIPPAELDPEEFAALNARPDVRGIVQYMAAALAEAEKRAGTAP